MATAQSSSTKPWLVQDLSWTSLLESYKRSKTAHERMSMIHLAFTAVVESPEEESFRLRVLMKLADNRYKRRQLVLTEKAFYVLARHFFKNTDNVYELAYMEPQVLKRVMRFFRTARPLGGKLINIIDLQENNVDRHAHSFAAALALAVWDGSFFKPHRNPDNHAPAWKRAMGMNVETLAYAKTLKPDLLMIAFACGQKNIDALYKDRWSSKPPSWELFDQACLDRLKEVALGRRLPAHFADLEDPRKVTSIEESLYYGSYAAELYLTCLVAQKEAKRQKDLAEAEEKIEEGTRAREKLLTS